MCRCVLHHHRDVESGHFRLAIAIGEDNDTAALRIYGGVIGRRDDVFATVARANRERHEWRGVQQFSDAGNHYGILSQRGNDLKRRSVATASSPASATA
jgi:hypothetical protein